MYNVHHRLAAALLLAATLAPAKAGAQYYYQQSNEPPPPGFNRVIITNEPMRPDLGRPYPYVGNSGQPNYVQLPSYAPPMRAPRRAPYAQPRLHSKSDMRVSGKYSTKRKINRAEQAVLIEQLKKRPRVKKVTMDETGTTPNAAAPNAAANMMRTSKSGERVIRAEAEVRIHGNDEMSIRLFRAGGAPQASAR